MNNHDGKSYRGNPTVRSGLIHVRKWLLAAALLVLGAQAATAADPIYCEYGGVLPARAMKDPVLDVIVRGECYAQIGVTSYFGNVNIITGGSLRFLEQSWHANAKTVFWASSIIIENGGGLYADAGSSRPVWPFGTHGGTLTIYLYGRNEANFNRTTGKFDAQNKGVACQSEKQRPGPDARPCGIPKATWDDNGQHELPLPSVGTPVQDFFYQYGPLYGDGACSDGSMFSKGACRDKDEKETGGKVLGYFGNKVLAVSYGGTLSLFGKKGMISDPPDTFDPLNSGLSWMRLADGNSLEKGATSLVLEKAPGDKWRKGDEIVVTTTDYLPGHTEKLIIKGDDPSNANSDYSGGVKVNFDVVEPADRNTNDKTIRWPHNGVRYGGPNDKSGPSNDLTRNQWTRRLGEDIRKSMDPELVRNGAETRASVALLTRSIQVVSAGDVAGAHFGHRVAGDTDPFDEKYAYGAHLVARQGFRSLDIKGVEFQLMGQGGRLGHYPIHFHMARKTPPGTRVADSSINESMTRWIVLHSTHGVTVERNVGYKSIGHGFYLEDGTEIDNKFHSNIGIYARAAVATIDLATGKPTANPQNPRMVPGILADNQDPDTFKSPDVANQGFPYRSDNEYPTVFWIANGWNDFKGNMAAGAGACGAAYWLVPAAASDMVEMGPDHHMKWSGYAALQARDGFGGTAPLKSFYKNYATSTMHSLQTTSDAPACLGILAADAKVANDAIAMQAIRSDAPAPKRHRMPLDAPNHWEPDNAADPYYPHVFNARRPTQCWGTGDDACTSDKVAACGTGDALKHCAATVIDHYTSSFHWAQGDVSALWLRPQWYLVTNSVISDVQNGGLTFISGGDYTHSSVVQGYWAVARNTVFIGNTRDNAKYPFASNTGPFNTASKLMCDLRPQPPINPGNYCISVAEGISMPVGGFYTNQRLSNIYDGPSYQDTNAYLDITTADCQRWEGVNPGACMYGSPSNNHLLKKVPGPGPSSCYLPNAAIGWKQPNGFYYPPAFHSRKLFFDNVDLRHYVIDPLWLDGTYLTNNPAVQRQYCIPTGIDNLFDNWTSIDRQTVLNDDDGTLTGLTNTAEPGPLKQTISVNEDPFFNAPVETAECGSARMPEPGKGGDNASAAMACKKPPTNDSAPPATAKTSPYDFVTTVVHHKKNGDADLWASDCTHPPCYGVPLYRQYLTGVKDDKVPANATGEWVQWYRNGCDKNIDGKGCRWPFIRMAGSDISQRQTMTINNGNYYLDTNVSKETQQTTEAYTKQGRLLNVFASGQEYKVFFVYAKKSTVQTYQIYVGSNWDTSLFQAGRVDIDNKEDIAFFKPKTADPEWAKPGYDKGKGILTVKVDFRGIGTKLDPSADNGLCQPRSFCTPKSDGKACMSKLAADDPLKAESDAVCGEWAVKDLDCPVLDATVVNRVKQRNGGGCFGFTFTLKDFTADSKNYRQQPDAFPKTSDGQGKPDWKTLFSTIPSDKPGGRCNYASAPNCPP